MTDNGRGIPVDPHPKFKSKSALEVIMTTLHSGGKFDSKVYNTSGGLHGVGVSVVNALSEKLEVEVARGQQLYAMEFARGAPLGKLKSLGSVKNRRGTKVRFKPDEKIFGKGATFKPQRLFRMARSKAYLFGGVEIRWFCAKSLITDDTPVEATFHFPGGLKDYLEATIEGQTRVTKDIFAGRVEREGGHGSVEWAVCWVADEDGFLNSYCNTIPTAEGGTHENGFRSALGKGAARLRRARRQQARRQHHRRRRAGHGGRHALGVHPRARVPGPDQGQARHPGSHPHRRGRRARRLRPLAGRQPPAGDQAARLGRSTRPRSGSSASARRRSAGRRPRASCGCPASSPTAASTPRSAPRSSSSRATRPAARPSRRATASARPCCRLRGKILNVANASSQKLSQNQLLSDLIQALGVGTGARYRDEDLRYERVIVMTDADVDGAHIASLLITFFFQEMPELIEQGHLFLAMPPLYKLTHGAKSFYARDDKHKDELIKREFPANAKVEISRFKGLGEMNAAQLKETTMDASKRTLLQVSAIADEKAAVTEAVNALMGSKPEARFRFIQEHAAFAKDLDI